MLTVETEVNSDSKSTNIRGPFKVGSLVRGPCRAGTRDFCPALLALVGTAQYILFLSVHYFNSFVPVAQLTGQAVVLAPLSLMMCLCACRYWAVKSRINSRNSKMSHLL
jgi:hypothetical protein